MEIWETRLLFVILDARIDTAKKRYLFIYLHYLYGDTGPEKFEI